MARVYVFADAEKLLTELQVVTPAEFEPPAWMCRQSHQDDVRRRWRAGWTLLPARTAVLGLSEVAQAADPAQPTARPILLTLDELGYVREAVNFLDDWGVAWAEVLHGKVPLEAWRAGGSGPLT